MSLAGNSLVYLLIVGALCGCGGTAPSDEEGPSAALESTQDELRCDDAFSDSISLGMLAPPVPGGSSEALAINEQRTVVGESALLISPDWGVQRAFRWKPSTGMVDLGSLGGEFSAAVDVNERDQVAGRAVLADDTLHAVVWDAHNRIRDLGTLGGTQSYALALNNRGQVIGMSETTPDRYRPFIWDAHTGMVELDLPVEYGVCKDINDFGVVVGALVRDEHAVPFKWTQQTGFIELDTLGFLVGEATSINDRGEIVGYVSNGGDAAPWIATKWTARGAQLLPSVADHDRTRPKAINDFGIVVGEDITFSITLGIRWDTSGRSARVLAGPNESLANDVNDRGDIVGVWNTGHREATLWQRKARRFW